MKLRRYRVRFDVRPFGLIEVVLPARNFKHAQKLAERGVWPIISELWPHLPTRLDTEDRIVDVKLLGKVLA